MLSHLLSLFLLIWSTTAHAQFPPAAGEAGSTAIIANSPLFLAWANTCHLEPGPQDISDPGLGLASFGATDSALGPAGENGTVSLGDGGSAILTFDPPIRNGASWDFAIFENGFQFGNNEVFLELAFVEVSSDGSNFFRFPASSLTDTQEQVGSFGGLQASQLNNLAGKYRASFGTPFDLEELAGQNGLDINQITHVRLIDVVGSIDDAFASYDAEGRKINDPFPTPFPSSGFDLDAIGVLHQFDPTSTQEQSIQSIKVFPNPVKYGQEFYLDFAPTLSDASFQLLDAMGKVVLQDDYSPNYSIPTYQLARGFYFLSIRQNGQQILRSKIIIQ